MGKNLGQRYGLLLVHTYGKTDLFAPVRILRYFEDKDDWLMANISPQQLEELQQAAWQAAQEGKPQEAHQHAQALIDQGLEIGYQIRVMLFIEDGDLASALQLVDEGATRNDQSWSMRVLQSDVLSMAGEGEQALAALAAARELPEAQLHWIQIGEATIYGRMMDMDRALNLLQEVDHPDAINSAIEMQFALLDTVGRHDLIIEMAEEDLDALQPPEDPADAAVLSRIMTQVAQAYWYEDEDEDTVEHYLKMAIAFDRSNPDALYLRRELDHQFSEKSRTFELSIQGQFRQEIQEQEAQLIPFQTRYQVIADSEEEALEFISNYESDDISASNLQIVASQSEPNQDEELKGVYVVTDLLEAEG